MCDGVRVKLCFCNVLSDNLEKLRRSWIFVPKSVTYRIGDFIRQIKDKFNIRCEISLELDGYEIPPHEDINLLKDNDEIRVVEIQDVPLPFKVNQLETQNAKETLIRQHEHDECRRQPIGIASNNCEDNEYCISQKIEKGGEVSGVDIKRSDMDGDGSDCGSLNKLDDVKVNRRRRKRKRPLKSKTTSCPQTGVFVSGPTNNLEKLQNFSISELPEKYIVHVHKRQKINSQEAAINVTTTSEWNFGAVQAPRKTQWLDDLEKVKVYKRSQRSISNEVSSTILSLPPTVGSTIKFRMLEISSDYTPTVSDFKKAEVISCCHSSNTVQLQFLENFHDALEAKHDGRFEITIEDHDQILTNKLPDTDKVNIAWSDLIEPSLVL